MTNQNLFEALQRVCGFTALESDMAEIINAYEKDLELSYLFKPQESGYAAELHGTIDKINALLTKHNLPDQEFNIHGFCQEYCNIIGYSFCPQEQRQQEKKQFEKDLLGWKEIALKNTIRINELEAELAALKAKQQCNHIWEPVFGMNTVPDYHRCKICLTIK